MNKEYLKEIENERSSIAKGIAHEVKNPLQYLQSGVDYLQGILDDATQQSILEDMQHSITRIDNVVKKLFYLSNMTLTINSTNISQLCIDVVESFQQQMSNNNIKLNVHITSDLTIVGDAKLLNILLVELINNALEATNTQNIVNERRVIDLFLTNKKHQVILTITSNTFIKEDKLALIFNPFFTTGIASKNVGLGLNMIEKIVGLHKGSFDLKCVPNDNVIVKVVLPEE